MTNTEPYTPATIAHEAREMLRDLVLGNEGPDVIRELRYTARVVETLTTAAVRDLRAGGASWSEIGLALGTSRQAAHERYADTDDDTE